MEDLNLRQTDSYFDVAVRAFAKHKLFCPLLYHLSYSRMFYYI